MSQVKCKLLRPLDDQEIGAEVMFDKADAERLAGYGAVKIMREKPKAEEPVKKADAPLAEKAEPKLANKADTTPANKGAAVDGKTAKAADGK